MSNISLIIQREYNERVRKKSFIIATILMPLLMIGLMVTPTLIMIYAKSDVKTITVVDQSGIIAGELESSSEIVFQETSLSPQAARDSLKDEDFGVLVVGEYILTNNKNITLYTNSASSVTIEEGIISQIKHIIETERLKSYNIENLSQIMKEVEANVSLSSIRNDKGDQASQSSMMAMAIGGILGMMLYMFLIIYGVMVMTSVIEEKGSRVLEVLVSSVKPFELMVGKILSIALVAVTQLVIWTAIIIIGGAILIPAIMPDDIMQSVAAVQSGSMMSSDVSGVDPDMVSAIATITDFGYIAEIMGYSLLFLVGGFLLYSAMFAAIGSAVDTVEDSQNLQTPVTIPIILSFLILGLVSKDPNSTVVTIFSMIPLTSPIVMMSRIPYGIATWEIVLSLVLLVASFIVMVWVASKIYRVGIFMHGKKPSFKELWKWFKY